MDETTRNFLELIYRELDDLFEGEVKVLSARNADGSPSPAVRVLLQASGDSVDVSDYESQMKNAILGKLHLLKQQRPDSGSVVDYKESPPVD